MLVIYEVRGLWAPRMLVIYEVPGLGRQALRRRRQIQGSSFQVSALSAKFPEPSVMFPNPGAGFQTSGARIRGPGARFPGPGARFSFQTVAVGNLRGLRFLGAQNVGRAFADVPRMLVIYQV